MYSTATETRAATRRYDCDLGDPCARARQARSVRTLRSSTRTAFCGTSTPLSLLARSAHSGGDIPNMLRSTTNASASSTREAHTVVSLRVLNALLCFFKTSYATWKSE